MSGISENKPIVVALLIVVAAIVALITFFLMTAEDEKPIVKEEISIPAPTPPPKVEPDPEPVVIPEPEPVEESEPEEEPIFVLPLLNESDQLIRDGVVSLTRHEGINAWLSPNELIRKFVAFVDNVAHGQVAKEPVRFLAPEGPFLVTTINETTFAIDPASYDRYDRFTEIVVSIDARRASEFYHLLRPLVQKAYGELGYGDRSFDDVLFEAIGRLLETPVLDGPVRLSRPVVMFKYEDEKLESLSPAQKQLIRMGPRNSRMLQAKISEVALELRAILGR
ncbi:MAG: DUF3014 domain-containing protein [Gammaproteobacteria bacterium]|nr:DUF3014 domain-containing protein [Gammaproteobacteria bacterium]